MHEPGRVRPLRADTRELCTCTLHSWLRIVTTRPASSRVPLDRQASGGHLL